MKTRERILKTALKMFNERGIHGVGVRDIARQLEMSPGNLQYHFKKKEDLVVALIEEWHAFNSGLQVSVPPEKVTLRTVYELTLAAYRNHIRYRGVILSYPEAVAHSPRLRKLEDRLEQARARRSDRALGLLVENGILDGEKIKPRVRYLAEQGALLGRFWLPAAVIKRGNRRLQREAEHHARLSMLLLEPYLTPRGRSELEAILASK